MVADKSQTPVVNSEDDAKAMDAKPAPELVEEVEGIGKAHGADAAEEASSQSQPMDTEPSSDPLQGAKETTEDLLPPEAV